MERVEILRGSMYITLRCTLKCKLCAAYVPCYDNPPHFSTDYIERSLKKYFEIVDYVGDFSISGGEPLLHPEIDTIINEVFKYEDQFDRFLVLTNGTLLFKDSTINLLKKYSSRKKVQINISNYGKISTHVSELTEQLEKNGIQYRVINYTGDNLFSGGWIDYGDHSKKIFTLEEREKQGENCVFSKMQSSVIIDGELHRCGRAFRRMELGIIPRNKEEYVDLFDDSISLEEKKRVLKHLITIAKSTTSCAYCNSMKKDSKRFPPAEQL